MGTSEESVLVAKGVKSLRIFVEKLDKEGATLTTKKYLKVTPFSASRFTRKGHVQSIFLANLATFE